MKTIAALLCLSSIAVAAPHRGKPTPPGQSAIDGYYDVWLRNNPIEATQLGIHAYDGLMPDLSEKAEKAWAIVRDQHAVELKKELASPSCDLRCKIDLRAVLGYIARNAFDLDTLKSTQRYPDLYVETVNAGVFPLIKRSFAPLPDRMELVIARLGKTGEVLAQGRNRLVPALVSQASVEIALEELEGSISFIGTDVPAAFASLPPAQRARVKAAADGAVQSLRDYQTFLKLDLRGSAVGAIAIGETLLTQKLAVDEMIDEPLPALLARGEAELKRLQAAFLETARAIDPKKDPRVLAKELAHDHPAANEVLDAIRGRLTGLRSYLADQHIVTVPSQVLPIVEETPPFMRATTQASMDTPGAYETRAKEAFYNVTLPEASWSKERVDNYLSGAFNRTLIDIVSIHEVFPGHYVQFLWMPLLTSRARRMQGVSSNIEGWAHYAEQMMIEEGWGAGSPRIKLAQLADALLRAARYVVAIRVHARGLSIADAKKFFVSDGFQSEEVATIESKRAVEDSTFLYYTWGKLQLLALRAEMKAHWGETFTLQRFHDAIMAEGPIALPLLREALLAR